MTRQAVCTVVDVATPSAMFRVHGCFVVLMAIQASEYAVACWVCVAVRAGIPFTFVCTAVNGEIFAVVIKFGTLPGIDGMTSLAVFRKTGAGVVRIRGGIVVCKMTRNAFFG